MGMSFLCDKRLHQTATIYSHLTFITSSNRLRSVGVASNSKESSNVAVVEGIAAFACVPVPYINNPTSGSKSGLSEVTGYFYSCTVATPQLMLERLNKEIAEVAEGPVNLLETIGIEIQFRKTLTRKCTANPSFFIDLSSEISAGGPRCLITLLCLFTHYHLPTAHSWGILLYENLYALNIVFGGDLRTTLRSRRFRLILGLMVREFREVRC